MTYQEFKNKYNGVYTDVDGFYGCQCWDLAQAYFTQVLNLPWDVLSGCGDVKNMLWGWKRDALNQYFDEVPITAMYPGDVCIWETNHIAIFDNWDGYNCYYFSQNPNPPQVMQVHMDGLHAFRLKGWNNQEEQKPAETPIEEVVVDDNLTIGTYVKITGYGNGSSYGDSNTAVPGYEGTITNIYEGRPFPYEISDYEGVLGYYPKESLSK